MMRLMQIALLGSLVATTACGTPQQNATTRDNDSPESAAVPQALQDAVASIGEQAAQALRSGLSARLTAAMNHGGPVAAIEVCASEALPLTDSIARASPQGTRLKRVSLRTRNPLNEPDSLELAALQWFAAHDAERPASLIQVDGAYYRYYSPLRVAAPCVNCHGRTDDLAPAVREAMAQRYPDDRATGYAEGDLRGLIRVSVPAASVSATAGS